MRFYEFESKAILAKQGVRLPKGGTAKTGDERIQCWADVDKTLSEDIVPWITVRFSKYPVTVSANVVNYTFDQFAGQPSLDNIGVADATGSAG